MKIPREYYLEEPARYSRQKFCMHMFVVLQQHSIDALYGQDIPLFTSFFRKGEHTDIALDLLRYVVDIDPQNKSTDSLIIRLASALDQAGYFG